jgi:hypothetical protein
MHVSIPKGAIGDADVKEVTWDWEKFQFQKVRLGA